MFGIGEGAILVLVIVLLLGAKKIPDLARSAGKSMRILKSEARALKREGAEEREGGTGAHGAQGARGGEPPRSP